MTNHTPWRNIDNVITDSEGFEIAIVYGEVNGKQEQEVAQLIAAAPELLTGVREALKDIKRLNDTEGHNLLGLQYLLEEAIKKAEGK